MIQNRSTTSRYEWRSARLGFSFTEILFAVMILGVGFIMVAAVFPVAIKQTQETVDETTAADVAKGAASYLQRIGTSANFPPTSGKVVQYTGPAANANSQSFWQSTSGNLILSTDPRYAWVPFYSRGGNTSAAGVATNASSYAQVTIISVLCRNNSSYNTSDLAGGSGANLVGRPLSATFNQGTGTNPDTISLSGAASSGVAEGAYVIVADDSNLQNVQNNPSLSADGNVYRVGASLGGTNWELMPGCDTRTSNALHPAPVGGAVNVFVVGRGFTPGSTTPAGAGMDIAAYSTFIQIH